MVFYDHNIKKKKMLPVLSRSVPDTAEAFHEFRGPEPNIGLVYSDQARERLLAAWHHTSTPGVPATNGSIDNKVKLILHGARVLLRQAGSLGAFCAVRTMQIFPLSSSHSDV